MSAFGSSLMNICIVLQHQLFSKAVTLMEQFDILKRTLIPIIAES